MSTLALARPAVNPGPAADPRESWPAWTDEDRWELGPDPAPIADDDVPRPSAGPDFRPCPEDDAERLGYALGLDREDAAPPAGLAPSVAGAFRSGWAAGSREWDRRLDAMFADAAAEGRITDLDAWPRGVC